MLLMNAIWKSNVERQAMRTKWMQSVGTVGFDVCEQSTRACSGRLKVHTITHKDRHSKFDFGTLAQISGSVNSISRKINHKNT